MIVPDIAEYEETDSKLAQLTILRLHEEINKLEQAIKDTKENADEIIVEQAKEIERLNNKYNKALELLSDFNMPCEYDEGKIPDNYCEENCSDDYKKCWNKYIELELKGDSSNE